MKTWNSYKKYVAKTDSASAKIIDEAESTAEIITAMIKRRADMGISQRNLATMCGIPQSSVARIESMRSAPKIDTLQRILTPLGLKLGVTAI